MTKFERLTEVELPAALPLDLIDETIEDEAWPPESPREALEAIIEPVVRTAPCFVLFSGGRDSSAVLALALSVARRIGADDPVPVIYRHPGSTMSDETPWQEQVLHHLGLDQPLILEFRGDQAWLGALTTDSLRRHGLLWPPAVHLHGAIYRHLRPGALLSGEGGDMTVEGRRISPLVAAVKALRPRRTLRELATLLRERGGGEAVRGFIAASTWLTPQGAEYIERRYRWDAGPLRWDRDLESVMRSRMTTLGSANHGAMARAWGLEPTDPFEHPRFVAALIRAGGRFGLGGRTDMMRALFADLLPDAVLARTTKAAFNDTRWSAGERAFARDWSGGGVDRELIDVERLRQEWLTELPFTISSFHLHAAWLHDHGLPSVPDGT